MAPDVDLMTWATPPLPLAARAVPGHLTVELVPSVHTLGTAVSRNSAKFCVVPEESERTAMVIGVDGRVTPGLADLIAALFQVVILPWKMSAMRVGVSFRLLTPDRLYASAIGPSRTGKYRTFLPLKLAVSLDGMGESEPAKLTVPAARLARPVPEPTPL